MLLSEAQIEQLSAAIAEAERRTDAELVTVLARQADDYRPITIMWAALASLALAPVVLSFAWLDAGHILLLQWMLFLCLTIIFRLPGLAPRLVPGSIKRSRAQSLARCQFLSNELHHTAGASGILIFVSEAEHYVEILADRGINQHVQPDCWDQIVEAFVSRVKEGQTFEGFLGCVSACGELLAKHAPATSEKNELPNRVVLLR
jgi:putative membrane protein